MTTVAPRLDLLAAGLLQPGDRVVFWFTGELVTCPIDAERNPDEVEWWTITAVDEQGEHVRITFDDRVWSLPADDDVVVVVLNAAPRGRRARRPWLARLRGWLSRR